MVTPTELAELLLSVNVKDVAKAANVSEKTIYRLRLMKTRPTITKAAAIVKAARALKAKERRKQAGQGA